MAFGKSKPQEWRSKNFKIAFVCTAIALIIYLIAFASPYWLQTYHSVPFDFKNMGLWEICLNNYFFRDDAYITEFDGCYWSFAVDLEVRRGIFNPGFFVMCQIFSVVALLAMVGTTMLMSGVFTRCTGEENWTYWVLSITMSGLMSITSILLFVIIVTIGAKSRDRLWMVRADLVWLSWGYAAACLANIFAIVAAVYFGKEAKQFWGSKALLKQPFGFPLFRQGDAAVEPPAESGSVFGY
ncbi:uncharacterized protein [Watersipora subatra]|uniref:uncharacterized protein n=1 Tax=Watersipora subatra TaxID=2589382 RepID=UPI00355BDD3F